MGGQCMDMNIVKDYLKSYRDIKSKVAIIELEIEELEEQAEAIVPVNDGMPKEIFKADRTGNLAVRIADMVRGLSELRLELMDRRKAVSDLILAIPDSRYSQLLYKRYILLDTWDKIANDMHYDHRYILRLHGEALLMVAEILPQCSGNKTLKDTPLM